MLILYIDILGIETWMWNCGQPVARHLLNGGSSQFFKVFTISTDPFSSSMLYFSHTKRWNRKWSFWRCLSFFYYLCMSLLSAIIYNHIYIYTPPKLNVAPGNKKARLQHSPCSSKTPGEVIYSG